MTDAFRQSTGDKLADAAKPDSQKTTLEKAGDTLKGGSDDAASKVEGDKSTSQKAMDAVTPNKSAESTTDKATGNTTKDDGKGLLASAKDAITGNNQ